MVERVLIFANPVFKNLDIYLFHLLQFIFVSSKEESRISRTVHFVWRWKMTGGIDGESLTPLFIRNLFPAPRDPCNLNFWVDFPLKIKKVKLLNSEKHS